MLGIALTIFVGAVLIAAMFALSAVIISSRISHIEEQEYTRFTQAIIDDVGKK